ncbi:MAG: hypothetical protein Q9207_003484, partial [Kuettlingeria erythrocarpa]
LLPARHALDEHLPRRVPYLHHAGLVRRRHRPGRRRVRDVKLDDAAAALGVEAERQPLLRAAGAGVVGEGQRFAEGEVVVREDGSDGGGAVGEVGPTACVADVVAERDEGAVQAGRREGGGDGGAGDGEGKEEDQEGGEDHGRGAAGSVDDERPLGKAMMLEHGFRETEDTRETVHNDLKLGELAPFTLAQPGGIIIAAMMGGGAYLAFPSSVLLRLCRGCK